MREELPAELLTERYEPARIEPAVQDHWARTAAFKAVEATGYDIEEIDRENAADAARANELGLGYRTKPGETQGARATPERTPETDED